ncbi:MAG TPA: hypothetical protein VHM19_02975 [Polyangiales bacterium]|jgi:hypothetical protein|nr:hypothetical protein [Polyangiales bacterium]
MLVVMPSLSMRCLVASFFTVLTLGLTGCPGDTSPSEESGADGGAAANDAGKGGGGEHGGSAGHAMTSDSDAATVNDFDAASAGDAATAAERDAGTASVITALKLSTGDVTADLMCHEQHGVLTYDEGEWVGVAFDSFNNSLDPKTAECGTPSTENHFVLVVLAGGGPNPKLANGTYDLADSATASKLAVRLIVSGPGETDGEYTEYGSLNRLKQPLPATGTVEVRKFETGADGTHQGSAYDVELHDVVLQKSYASANTPFANEATVEHALLR